jgi:hypothetical protein
LELRYQVRITGVPAERLMAVALQRVDSAGPGPVVYRLAGPGATAASGALQLGGAELQALEAGRYQLTLFTADRPAGAASGRIGVPR